MQYISITDYIFVGMGILFLLIWLVLYFKYSKYNSFFEPLEEKEFPLKECYSFGYGILQDFKIKCTGKTSRKIRRSLSVIYDDKYVEYYLRVTYSQCISISSMLFIASFCLYGVSGEPLIILICLIMAAVLAYYFLTLPAKKVGKRSEEMLSDFCEVVSKLALLTNAGMIMREAWNEVAYTSNSTIYKEMQITCDDIKNGISEIEAIRRFGLRCMFPEAKRFSSTIIQGIEKGNRELAMMLKAQSDEVWKNKQEDIKRQGIKANSKLLIPMFIMFIGVLIMIIVPILSNIGA